MKHSYIRCSNKKTNIPKTYSPPRIKSTNKQENYNENNLKNNSQYENGKHTITQMNPKRIYLSNTSQLQRSNEFHLVDTLKNTTIFRKKYY